MAKNILCKKCDKFGTCKETCLDEAAEECVAACNEIKRKKQYLTMRDIDAYEMNRSKIIKDKLKRYGWGFRC